MRNTLWDRIKGSIRGGVVKFLDDDTRTERPIMTILNQLASAFGSGRTSSNAKKRFYGIAFAVINAIADGFSAVNVRLYRRSSDGKSVEEVVDHPALKLLKNPNSFMTEMALREVWAGSYEISGNVYWLMMEDDEGKGMILPLLPEQVKVVPRASGTGVERYDFYTSRGQVVKISPEHIIQWRSYNPHNPFEGIGAIEAASHEIDSNLAATIWNERFFDNSARPDFALVMEEGTDLDADQVKEIKTDWKSKHGGLFKAFEPTIIQGALKDIKNLNFSHKDMEFASLKTMTRDEILAIFRVPKTVVAITDDVNRANAETTDYVFAERRIKPLLRKYCDVLNNVYLKKFNVGDNLFFSFDDPTPENRELSLREDTEMTKTGILTINEVRKKRGYDEIEGGDVVYLPSSVQPLGGISSEANSGKKVSDLAVKIKSALKDVDMSFEIRGAVAHKGLVERAKKWEDKVRGVASNLFKDMEAEALANVGNLVNREKGIGFKEILDVKNQVLLWIRTLKPLFTKLYEDEGEGALLFLGVGEVFEVDSDGVKNEIANQMKRLAKEVVRTSVVKLTLALQAGVERGEGIPELRRRIMDLFKDMSPIRAEAIARTEVITASNSAQLLAWKQSGVVVRKIWYTALDERVCPWCMELHGTTVSLDKNFVDYGHSLIGTNGKPMEANYRGIGEPSLHPNCRCTILPVVDDKAVQSVSIKKQIKDLEESNTAEMIELKNQINDVIRKEG